jgi:uncharacterized protein YegP (UPF0339 family)
VDILYTDIFVLKLDSSGSYQWHTFYGSSNYDDGYSLFVDASGNVYVTGDSFASWNGPSGQSPLHTFSEGVEILDTNLFVLKLDSSGEYQWHTFYGSSNSLAGRSISVDASGNLYATGDSQTSWNGPEDQSPLHAFSGYADIFVLKLTEQSTGLQPNRSGR